MSIHGSKPSDDEETTMRASSQAHQPNWMSHWMKGSSKEAFTVDRKSYSAPNGVKIGEVPSRSGREVSKDAEKVLTGSGTRNLSNKSEDLQNEISKSSVPAFRLYRNAENNSTIKTQVDPDCGPEKMSLALSIGREATSTDLNYLPNPKFRSSEKHEATSMDFGYLPDHKFRSNETHGATTTDLNYLPNHKFRSGEKHGLYNIYEQGKGAAVSGTFGQTGSTSRALPHQSHHEDASQPIVVFEKHFSNDNFTCFDQDNCKYKKYSSFMVHDKNMKNDPSCELRDSNRLDVRHGPSSNKNFQAFFKKLPSNSVQNKANGRYFPTNGSLSNIHQSKPYHGGHQPDTYPWPVRNVETMRICTMVDSVETGDPHKISQRSRNYLFTKESCFNISGHQVLREPYASGHSEEQTFTGPFGVAPSNPGVKIQPLWTSTDSEQEDADKPSVFKAGSRNDASAETNGMQVEAPMSHNTLLGTASSLLQKNDTTHEDSSSAAFGSSREKTRSKRSLTEIPDMNEESSSVACDSSREKTRNKRPLIEIPDMNEELPGPQPAVSSTDGKESSTSRVHSLNAKHLFLCEEHASKSESNSCKNRPLALESSNRWIKRLRLNSSDSFGVGTKNSNIDEGSAPEKFNLFFNRIAKCNKESVDPELSNQHSTEQVALNKNVECLRNGGSSSMVPKKRNESVMQNCSWIQRWSQRSNGLLPKTPEPPVICEPHRLKLGQDDLPKKQFPSIAALALMGKAMNGIRSCEFKKRGPVVVWNTKEYSD